MWVLLISFFYLLIHTKKKRRKFSRSWVGLKMVWNLSTKLDSLNSWSETLQPHWTKRKLYHEFSAPQQRAIKRMSEQFTLSCGWTIIVQFLPLMFKCSSINEFLHPDLHWKVKYSLSNRDKQQQDRFGADEKLLTQCCRRFVINLNLIFLIETVKISSHDSGLVFFKRENKLRF